MTTDNNKPTRQEEFKRHLAVVIQDIQQAGQTDSETMALIGVAAVIVVDRLRQADWTSLKRSMSEANYTELLQSFDTQGNALHKAGRTKQAYAIQALATSLVARSWSADPDLAAGENLLDNVIDRTIVIHRKDVAQRH